MKRLSIIVLVAFLIGGTLIWATTPNKNLKAANTSALAVSSESAAPGIQFENISFRQAMAQAKNQHKLIFLNVYATWCMPCKMLMKNTLDKPEIGNVFNKKFVNVSYDAEKGEGIDLVKKYNIQAHPIMLMVDANGQVVKRILGYRTPDQLLTEIKDLK